MLVIGNSIVDPSEGNHWTYKVSDTSPVIIQTNSNEHTFNTFLKQHEKHKQVAIIMSDFVHQQVGNIVYNWSNDNYLDVNHTRRRDTIMMGHTPETLVEHNKLWYNSIKTIRPDTVILTEWASSKYSIFESILNQQSDDYYNKYSLSEQFIRWCNIYNLDRQKYEILDGLVNKSECYTNDFDYTDIGHNKIADLYESARSSVG